MLSEITRSVKNHPAFRLEALLNTHQVEALEQTRREVKQAEKFALGLKGETLASLIREHLQEFLPTTSITDIPGQEFPEEQPQEEAIARMTGTTGASELPRQLADDDLSDVASEVNADSDSEDEGLIIGGGVQADAGEEESLTGHSIRSHQSARSSQQSSPRGGGPRRLEPRLRLDSGIGSIERRSGSGSLESSSSSMLSITSRDTHPVAAKRSPPSDLDASTRQEMQDEISRLQGTIHACYRAILSMQKNADLKVQQLELKVLFLERKLADEQVLTNSLQTSNQSLKRELQAAFTEAKEQDNRQKMKKMISLHQKEVTMENHLNALLKARNEAVHQNTLLKRMLLQTCHDCRNKLPIRKARKNLSSTSQLVSASLSLSEGQEAAGLPAMPPLTESGSSGGSTATSRRRPSNTAPKSPQSPEKKVVVQSSVQRAAPDEREELKSSTSTAASAATKKAGRVTPPRSRSSSSQSIPAATSVSSIATTTRSRRTAGGTDTRSSTSSTGLARFGQQPSSTELTRSGRFSSSSIELTTEEFVPPLPTSTRAAAPARAGRQPGTDPSAGGDHTGSTEEDTSTSTLTLTRTPPTTRTVVGERTVAAAAAAAATSPTSSPAAAATASSRGPPATRAPPDRQSSGSGSIPLWRRMLGGNK